MVMNERRGWGAIVLALTITACGDDQNETVYPGTQTGTGGTSGIGGNGAGGSGAPGGGASDTGGGSGTGGAGTPVPCGPAASQNAQGILTSHPGMTFVLGHDSFELETVNIVPSIAPSGIDTMDVYAELKNVSTEALCYIFSEATLDGLEILVIADTPPHTDEILTTTGSCLLPGETAILNGIQNDIPAATINGATVLSFNLTASESYGVVTVPVDRPTVTASIAPGTLGGDVVSGTVVPQVSIYNYGMSFYARDSRGLIVAELLAFPGELSSLPAGVSIAFSSEESECQFDEYVLIDSWIYE